MLQCYSWVCGLRHWRTITLKNALNKCLSISGDALDDHPTYIVLLTRKTIISSRFIMYNSSCVYRSSLLLLSYCACIMSPPKGNWKNLVSDIARFVVKNALAFTRFRTLVRFSPLGLNYTDHTIDSYESQLTMWSITGLHQYSRHQTLALSR